MKKRKNYFLNLFTIYFGPSIVLNPGNTEIKYSFLGPALWPVVKVPCAQLWQPRFGGLDPGHRPTPLTSHAVVAFHIQNRGRLIQLLAQGQSSSQKKKAIGMPKKSVKSCSTIITYKTTTANIEIRY